MQLVKKKPVFIPFLTFSPQKYSRAQVWTEEKINGVVPHLSAHIHTSIHTHI